MCRSAPFQSCQLRRVSSISEYDHIQQSESHTGRGLPEGLRTRSVQDIIHFLEDQARCGDEQARRNMQDLIPVCATAIPQRVQFWLRPGRALCFHIRLSPDLFVCIMRALCCGGSHDSELVCFMRSCMPFVYNSRRSHGDGGWSKAGAEDLITMFRCCMPTLLSLYPHHGVKDVTFWLRVAIFQFFQRLFRATHEERNAVFVRLKALFRVCFVEYVYFYMTNVTAIPHRRFMCRQQNELLYNNAFNMGQQLRVELNSAFNAAASRAAWESSATPADELMAILESTTPSCQVMYERNMRSSKVIFSGNMACLPEHKIRRRKFPTGSKSQRAMPEHVDLALLPSTSNFCIFERVCRARGLQSEDIVSLWEHLSILRLYELTSSHARQQMQALARIGVYAPDKVAECSTLHVCLRCAKAHVFSTYRCDLRSNVSSCTKCDRADMCVKIGMLGRVLFVSNIPIVMCRRCCRFVVYSGNDCDHDCNHILWGKHVFSPSFQSEFLSNTFMYFSYLQEQIDGAYCPAYASRRFISDRANGCKKEEADLETQGKTCCMCKSTALQRSYFLLDAYSKRMIHMRVCSRHALSTKYDNIHIYTLQQYLFIADTMARRGL